MDLIPIQVLPVLLLFGAVAFAVTRRTKRTRTRRRERGQPEKAVVTAATGAGGPTPRPHPMDPRIHWLTPKRTPLWVAGMTVLLALALPALLDATIPGADGDDPEHVCGLFRLQIMVWVLTCAMLAIFVPLLLKIRTVTSTRLGFRDEWVLVDHGNGTVRVARDEDLIAVANGFMIHQVTIPTGSPQMALYDRKALVSWLQPRLARGTKLGPISQLSWQWQHKRGMVLLSVAAIAAGLALVVALESGWLEARFDDWLRTQPACDNVLSNSRDSLLDSG